MNCDLINTISHDFYRATLSKTTIDVTMLNQEIRKTNMVLDSCLKEVKLIEEIDMVVRYRYETIKYIKGCKSLLNIKYVKLVNMPDGRMVDIDIWIEYRKQVFIIWNATLDLAARLFNTQVIYLKRYKFDLPLKMTVAKEEKEELRKYQAHTDSMIIQRQYNYPFKAKSESDVAP